MAHRGHLRVHLSLFYILFSTHIPVFKGVDIIFSFDALELITRTENEKNRLRLAPQESVIEGGETKQITGTRERNRGGRSRWWWWWWVCGRTD